MIELVSTGVFSYGKSDDRSNQDSVLPPVFVDGGYLFAIADGVGSYDGAEYASSSAIAALTNLAYPKDNSSYESFFEKIRKAVSAVSEKNASYSEAATTLTFCFVSDEEVNVGHVGDCRLYIKKGGRLLQITKDHTQHQKLLEQKIFTKAELRKMDVKNTLTTALSKYIELEYKVTTLKLKDVIDDDGFINIVILSDGAHSFWEKRPRFSDKTMANPNSYAASLYKRIHKSGPVDDYSCVAVRIRSQ